MAQEPPMGQRQQRSSERKGRPRGIGSLSLRLGSISGIEIRLDMSVAIVFALVVFSLGAGAFARWHPQWSSSLTWITALFAGLLFFVSLLAHELSHSLVAKLRGIPVPRITLFVFGGVSELQREPNSPRTEFFIAIVGPATSLILGVGCGALGAWIAGPALTEVQTPRELEGALTALGPVSTLLLWLGPVNLMLGVFNLVPGFPLDGGRVLRAALWGLTHDLVKATWWASTAGRVVAWGLMGLGVFQALGGSFIQGMWLVLIGWFLNNAARSSYAQLLVRRSIGSLMVHDLMQTRFDVVHPDMTLQQLVDQHILRGSQLAWPVVDGDRYLGLLSFEQVRATSEEERRGKTVRDLLQGNTLALDPDVAGQDALRALTEQDPLPVVRDGHVIGMLHRNDIMRRVALEQLEHAHHQGDW